MVFFDMLINFYVQLCRNWIKLLGINILILTILYVPTFGVALDLLKVLDAPVSA
jgi:hypothetical protein